MLTNNGTMTRRSLKLLEIKAIEFINNKTPLKTLYKKKPKFEVYIRLTLYLSSLIPSKKEEIGIFWIDNIHFALNTKNLAQSIGLKPNSLNCSLRQHQIERDKNAPVHNLFGFIDKKNWKIMKDTNEKFQRSAVERNHDQYLLKWVSPSDDHENQQKISKSIIETFTNENLKGFFVDSDDQECLDIMLNDFDNFEMMD